MRERYHLIPYPPILHQILTSSKNPLPDHQPLKGVNMIGITNTQFNPSSYITKISELKKIIFLHNTNQVSTLNEYSSKPVPPPKYDYLLTHMWDMALDNPVTVLSPDINMYREGSATHDPFSSPHIIAPPSLYA